MGVHRADGAKLETNPTSVIGTNYIAPLTMATAYAGYANDGTYCKSVAIDSVTDSSGATISVPQSTCKRAVSKKIAQAVTYALKGPLESGTATASNPNDGTDHFGKTGTTDAWQQTWMIESSTKVTTAVWVGQTQGSTDLRTQYFNGEWAPQARHNIMINMQRAVDEKYGGGTFDAPDTTYTYGQSVTVPDVTGQSYAAAAATLTADGFSPVNGGTTDSSSTKGLVASTSPSSGSSAASGSAVTVYTSNGELIATPSVTGQAYTTAVATLAASGFANVVQKCVATTDQSQDQIVQSQNPEGGADGNPSKKITLTTLCFGTTTG
jgi:membrane peptidoglycan carboxypeptidase